LEIDVLYTYLGFGLRYKPHVYALLPGEHRFTGSVGRHVY
jgi:hypothetical protein